MGYSLSKACTLICWRTHICYICILWKEQTAAQAVPDLMKGVIQNGIKTRFTGGDYPWSTTATQIMNMNVLSVRSYCTSYKTHCIYSVLYVGDRIQMYLGCLKCIKRKGCMIIAKGLRLLLYLLLPDTIVMCLQYCASTGSIEY